MTACTYNCFMNVINISNSIIGVSILAMPYCFRKCGILLSILLIFLSGFLTRLACYLLLKSAIISRRRNFEFLAFHIFGTTGKLAVEISVIGFLIGVCIAFFVVIGDLGPPLAAQYFSFHNSEHLRTNVLILVGLCVALPLGMLRKIDSLTSLSALSIAFYACLILKIFAEAVPTLAENEWWHQVNWWQSDGILPCLPIFSMALSCQTQLFEFFDTMNDPSIKRMQSVVGGAVFLCSVVYIMVGSLGYIAFHDKVITGNVLVFLTPSHVTEVIKLGFIMTVAISFPLCLFPCRSSLHSLLFKQGFGHHDISVTPIPELRFRVLTVSLVIVTIGIAIMLPNIEFVLGIIGSTIGTLICLIFPALIFVKDTSKNTAEKRMAQILMGIGAFILLACTYSTLQQTPPSPVKDNLVLHKITPEQPVLVQLLSSTAVPAIPLQEKPNLKTPDKEEKPLVNLLDDNKRLEPPIPQEPDVKIPPQSDLDPQALQKEDKEILKDKKQLESPAPPQPKSPEPSQAVPINAAEQKNNVEKQEDILRKLEEQQKEQKLILEQQKQVLEELKHHQETHEAKERAKPPPVVEKNITQKLEETQRQQKLILEQQEQVLEELKQQKDRSPVADSKVLMKEQADALKLEETQRQQKLILEKQEQVLEELKQQKERVSPMVDVQKDSKERLVSKDPEPKNVEQSKIPKIDVKATQLDRGVSGNVKNNQVVDVRPLGEQRMTVKEVAAEHLKVGVIPNQDIHLVSNQVEDSKPYKEPKNPVNIVKNLSNSVRENTLQSQVPIKVNSVVPSEKPVIVPVANDIPILNVPNPIQNNEALLKNREPLEFKGHDSI